ncbi:hypothetical protein KO498_02785 [Lentibacter algarum]|nr:hypothetical protein [Lentibacter algarum]MBU2980731.1 hypothetical protein [Lentibacter algarum]
MSNVLKGAVAFSFVALVSACGGNKASDEEYVVVDPAPISVEPTFTGKYK